MGFLQNQKTKILNTFSKLDSQEEKVVIAKKQLFNTLLLKGQFSELLGKPSEAIKSLEKAYELYPDNSLCQKLIFLSDLTGDKKKLEFYKDNLNTSVT